MQFKDFLDNQSACDEAREWVGDRDAAEAWQQCERADWMLWVAARVLPRNMVASLACLCARTSLRFTKDPCVLSCIETTEAWSRGEVTLDEVRAARGAAASAASADAYAAAASAAAAADAYAADAAYAAASAASASAAYAADAYAAYAADAYAAASAASRRKALRQMSDLLRTQVTAEEFAIAVAEQAGD